MATAQEWIDRLQLQPHPEGGWFRETYRSREQIAAAHLPSRFGGDRTFATMIYYMLESEDYSAFHRIKQDEGWHFYDGDPLTLYLISPSGELVCRRLGRHPARGEEPQALAPAGWYFGAKVEEPGAFALMGCTVAPGFDFADFEMPPGEDLARLYPQHSKLIHRLTR